VFWRRNAASFGSHARGLTAIVSRVSDRCGGAQGTVASAASGGRRAERLATNGIGRNKRNHAVSGRSSQSEFEHLTQASDHSAVSVTTPSAGGGSQTFPRGRHLLARPPAGAIPTCPPSRRSPCNRMREQRGRTKLNRQSASNPDHWRRRAAEARELADQMPPDSERRRVMLRIARDYGRLADIAAERRDQGSTPRTAAIVTAPQGPPLRARCLQPIHGGFRHRRFDCGGTASK
jgi:hypothetical protein